MPRLLDDAHAVPRLIASSVIRGASPDSSHGGLCIVDCRSGSVDWVLDWNSPDIDVDERGGDRGLRGIGIAGDSVYVMSSVALIRLDRHLRPQATYRNPYLKHCHELSIHDGRAYIVSTGFDSIVCFDFASERFIAGIHVSPRGGGLNATGFDPESPDGPAPSHVFHLNSVHCDGSGLYFSGLRSGGLLRISGTELSLSAALPAGTHNAQPFLDGVIYNDTEANRLCVKNAGRTTCLPVTADADEMAQWQRAGDDKLARPLFARGLHVVSSRLVATGASPSTISIHDLEEQRLLARVELSRDVRNAIHGLAAWPFPA
jgi:hypothetical protein